MCPWRRPRQRRLYSTRLGREMKIRAASALLKPNPSLYQMRSLLAKLAIREPIRAIEMKSSSLAALPTSRIAA